MRRFSTSGWLSLLAASMRIPGLAAVAILAIAGVARGERDEAEAADRSRPGARAAGATCRLSQAGAEATTSRDCISCHAAGGRDSHPVDLDYERARSRSRQGLRPLAEVVRRGVLLPNGEVRCVTCHDGRSPWKHRIALPPGAPARPAVNPRDRATYESRRDTATPLPPGSEVTPTPLCMACHALD